MDFGSGAYREDGSAVRQRLSAPLALRPEREASRDLVLVREPLGAASGANLRASVVSAASGRGLLRYRIHVGELIADLRYFAKETTTDLLIPRARALLLVSFNGPAGLAMGEETLTCRAETPFLCAGQERLSVAWRAGTVALIVYLKRDDLNAAASTLLDDGRRLGAAANLLPPVDDCRQLERAIDRIGVLCGHGFPLHGAASFAAEAAFYQALAQRIAASPEREAIVQPVRAVGDAMRLIRSDHCRTFDVESLAAMVGVTGGTLRKGFRACLGITVKEYIRNVRLTWARERLASVRESRSVADLAHAAGFADTAGFSRGYLRRYGESPSQTRARAVQLAE
ncbi:helix-turn-helix transcriptional regulator [Sandaracinobacteroides sayramensis]|uniref:helix-turn-helix transcriptional regulator n=1 Tax=Sandaracinobacteroides sayramensis TaxID=2913411 RepID=UPI001EDA5971|nr:AraC family transcriptional regulator [Sandaracinobacteroides sayramensis]